MQQQNPYVSITETDFGGGIDAATAENATPPTYLDDCKNVIPTYDGLLTKRKGYVTYGGYVPIRATGVYAIDSTTLKVYLPTNVDAYFANGSPLIVGGRTSVNGFGHFNNNYDTYHYYPTVSSDPRGVAAASSTTVINTVAAETGITSKYVLVQPSESTSFTTRNNTHVLVPCSINTTTYSINTSIVNGTSSPKYFYIQTLTPTYYSGTIAPSSVWTLSRATHGISHNNILARFFDTTGEEFVPDSVTIDSSGYITANIGTSKTGWIVLAAADQYNAIAGTSIGDGTVVDIIIENLTTPWMFCDVYIQNTSTGLRTRVVPESVTVDAETMTATVRVIDSSYTSHTFVAVWTCVHVPTPLTLTVSGATPSTTDLEPQLCIWGIDHEQAYVGAQEKAGWLSHVDSYSTATARRLVCGLGWNVFAAMERSEIGTTALLPQYYPLLEGILKDTTQIVGPAFVTTHTSGGRTRGDVAFNEVDSNGYTIATSLSYDASVGGGTHKITIPATGMVKTGTPILTGEAFCDYLTITQAPYTELVGSFKIRQITYNVNSIDIWIEPSSASHYLTTIFDVTNTSIKCGVFSDYLRFIEGTYLLPGDICISDVLVNSEEPIITAHETVLYESKIWLNGFTHKVTFANSTLILFKRVNSRVFQVRNALTQNYVPASVLVSSSLFNIVDGDMLQLDAYMREFRTVYAIPTAARSISISGATGTTATVTSLSSLADIKVGMYVPIFASVYAGVWRVTDILSATSFKIATTITTVDAGLSQLGGAFIQLDEEVPSIEGSLYNQTLLSVTRRWIPIETSTVDSDAGLLTHTKHFPVNDYDLQPPLRSVTIANNMYFTNGDDYVMKYDGTNIMRAGLPRWQAQYAATCWNSPISGGIYSGTSAITSSSDFNLSQIRFDVTAPPAFKVGDIIYKSADTGGTKKFLSGPLSITSVNSTDTSGTTTYFRVAFTGYLASGSNAYFVKPVYYRYYARLNIVDSNGNIIAGATTGYDDMVVASFGTSYVTLVLLAPPLIPMLDYSRVELELYRTKQSGVAPFYRIKNFDVSFNLKSGYIIVTDNLSDDQLLESSMDITVSTGLTAGVEVLPNIQGPPKAKYITTVNNRLLLGSLTSPQQCNLVMLEPQSTDSTESTFDGKVFLIRKDSNSTATGTDMVSRVSYEFQKDSSGLTISGVTSDGAEVVVTTTSAHGLVAGDWVYMTRASAFGTYDVYTRLCGLRQIASVTTSPAHTFTFKSDITSGITWDSFRDANIIIKATASKDIPVYIGVDACQQDELGNKNSYTQLPLHSFIAARRLSYAINASMRLCDTYISGQSSFIPWLLAGGGGDFKNGEVQLTVPVQLDTVPELIPPASTGITDIIIYGNGILRRFGESIGFLTQYFPSRMLMSYANYPEVFDNPFAEEKYSDSVLDINPSDGQYITGIIPMFGSSAFQLSQKAGYVIVFKERSIYVVNTEEKAAGRQYLQKLETNGIGCTLPYSIAYVKGGIAFANEAGIYRLNDQLKVELLSYKLGRLYSSRTDLSTDSLLLANGHHSPINQQYVLSYVNKTDSVLDEAWVYNYRREDKRTDIGLGSWCRYDNIPATVWCNQDDKEYFGSTKGRVFQMRAAGDLSDYRDDASGVSASVTFRAMDFGDTGIRKQCKHIFMAFRNGVVGFSGTQLSSSTNLETATWLPMQSFTQRLSSSRSIDSLRFSNPEGRFQYLQIKAENSTIDESMEIAGITYRVIGLSSMRTTEASGTGR